MTFATEVATDSPELWWDTREAIGTAQPDSSGNGHTGTIVGAPTSDADGLTFDPATDQHIEGDDTFGPTTFATWALEGVVNFASLPTYSHVAGFLGTGNDDMLFGLDTISGEHVLVGQWFDTANHRSSSGVPPTPIFMLAGTLQHLFVEYDGITVSVYLDGALYDSRNISGPGAIFASPEAFYLGNDQFGIGDGTDGLIRHGIFYTHTLGATRIAAHATAALADDPSPGGGITLTDPLIFDTAREHLAVDLDLDWTAGDVTALLVLADTWSPSAGDDVVDTILSAGAIETSGTRQVLGSPTASPPGGDHRVYWDGDPIVYPGVLVAETFDTLVLYLAVTDDTDSYLIAAYDLGAQTGDGNNVTLTPDTLGYVSV